jgi:DNA recombination protein RmuC
MDAPVNGKKLVESGSLEACVSDSLLHALMFVAGLLAGALAAWLVLRSGVTEAFARGQAASATELALAEARARHSDELAQTQARELQGQRDRLAEQQSTLDAVRRELAIQQERASHLPALEIRLAEREAEANRLRSELAETVVRLEEERKASSGQIAFLLQAKETLADQFRSLASEIMGENSKRFAEQSEANLGTLLHPLRERIVEFKAKVEEIHGKDIEQQAALKAELAQLKQLNQQMTEEAHGLATALKGQSKKQGNWGELILGNVLDRSGLREGQDFDREVSFTTEVGRRRPDVVVRLPQGKHLVIDAKVSLNAYTRYVNAEDDLARQQALAEHVSAIGDRIRELADRTYFDLPGLNSPEMVFMFIPVESAFVEALKADERLFQRAIEQNVLVATPTTLLTSLNIVRQLWRFEEQNAHTAELADRAGKVYRKLVTFLGSMEAVGKQLDKAKDSYNAAIGQLVTGRGNLISQAKEFERLGVSVQSALPEVLVRKAVLELDHVPAGDEAEDDTT